ncbi:MAG: TRAP transporter permease [Deltaproteobacteria bacterium]|nr:TRAP transporter permease [Deltaproteobacteria bacterium]MBW2068455.1 TRAP transporter permease [Deltaproteobacteria bacterium]
MLPTDFVEKDRKGIERARRIAEEESGRFRQLEGPTKFIVPFVAIVWCLFQMSIASWLILESTYIRAIHLACAMAITFWGYPALRKTSDKGFRKFIAPTNKIPLLDWIFGIVAVLAALYIAIDYEGISMRMGIPNTRDIIFGAALVITLLEAARRAIGPALPTIALLFTLYCFFGPYMPSFLAFKGTSLNRYVTQISLSTEGIYGIPLDVSASIVFYFVFFGAMLDRAGAGRYFIQLAISLLGGFKGGPAKAAIVGSALTGMVSGSSVANIVTTGTFTIPLMKSVGYPPKKAAAIEVAASTDGQLAPPIMGAAAFIIAEYLSVAYIDVVKAAAIPAFASYAALFWIVHVEASKLGLKGLSRDQLPRFWATLKSGLHFLIPVAVLVYELIIPRHTPELAAFRAIIVLISVMIIRAIVEAISNKESVSEHLKKTGKLLVDSMVSGGRNMVTVAVATAASGIIVGVVTMGLGGLITEIVAVLSRGNIYLMLIITAVASLLLGMGLPTTATYIVMASLTAPALVHVGAMNGLEVPLMAAHLFCFYFGILADDTPPVGLAAYAASAIANSEPIPTGLQGFTYDIRTAILPFMFIFNHDLILHNINSWPQALLIFAMACIGNFAFASATQGWFATWNKWYEVPFLLCVTLILMRPELASKWIGLPYNKRYFMYILGVMLFVAIYLWQKFRARHFGQHQANTI